MSNRPLIALVATAALAAGATYAWKTWYAPAAAPAASAPGAAAPPPPEVGIVTVKPGDVPLTLAYPGRVAGFRDVEIRPQVNGILLKREFEQGARVALGQVLFRIDPRTYQVALDRSKAQLAQAQATSRQADENYRRIEELAKRQVATDRQLDDARAAREQAAAAIQLAQAEVNGSELNLGFTDVKAPVAGVTSLTSPPEGTLIQTQQTLLTTITQLDPAYVNFSIADSDYQAWRNLNTTRATPITERDLSAELRFGDGTVYAQTGKIDVAGSALDPRTGTLQIRAIFPNADGAILPGQFVRLLVKGVTLQNAIVTPKQAVSQGPQGPFVYVVEANNVAQARPIRLGREMENGWIVDSGLKADDRVIVDGLMRIRPGAPVRPVPFQPPAAPGQPAPEKKP